MRSKGAWNHEVSCNCFVCLRIRNGAQRLPSERGIAQPTFARLEKHLINMVRFEVKAGLLRAFSGR